MKRKPKPQQQLTRDGLSPLSTISTLAKSPLLDVLDHHELVAMIRLIAATGAQRSTVVDVRNKELLDVPRTAIRTVQRLEEHGLVAITYPDGANGRRLIEVL